MPPLESTDSDSSLTSLPVAPVAKLRFKPKNTSLWNVIGMTPSCDHATLSSTASSTFLQTTPKHLALIMDKVPSWHGFLEQKCSLHVTNFIWPYLHQFFIDSHGLNGYGKPLKRPFDRY